MTLEELHKHVSNYVSYLKRTRAIRDIGELKYEIAHSKKSKSFYVKLSLAAGGHVYYKTVRFSDHPYVKRLEYPQKINGLIVASDRDLSKKVIKHVEAVLRKEIKKLRYCAHIKTIIRFTSDNP